jgi:hypothetical protein
LPNGVTTKSLAKEIRVRLANTKFHIWNPEEFSIFANKQTELKDKDLDRACDLYNRELEYDGSDEPARKLILQVTSDLAKMDWSGKLKTTDDFIVYAVDPDLADLRKNLKLTIPARQLAKLKVAKLCFRIAVAKVGAEQILLCSASSRREFNPISCRFNNLIHLTI